MVLIETYPSDSFKPSFLRHLERVIVKSVLGSENDSSYILILHHDERA